MKNNNKKYLIVDAEKIKITKTKVERICGFNDFWNDYVPCGETTAKKVFEEENLPEEFHKMIFSLPFFPWERECQEVLTKRIFYIYKNKKENKYTCDEQCRFYDGDIVPGALEFSTPIKTNTHEDIVNFYENLAEKGYLETYINAIKSMFYKKNELKFNNEEEKLENKVATLIKTNKKN